MANPSAPNTASFFQDFTVIVSVQASVGEPFYPLEPLTAMMHSVVNGGAQGLRLANMDAIAYARQTWPKLPIIGLTKPDPLPDDWQHQIFITPTLEEMTRVAEAGAHIIAIDATCRRQSEHPDFKSMIDQFKKTNPARKVMGDIATLDDATFAIEAGCDLLGTTLSGYTQESPTQKAQKAHVGPDFGLLEALLKLTHKPVLLEGRIWHPNEVTQAKALGAQGVVIGSAITRPHHITQRFVQAGL